MKTFEMIATIDARDFPENVIQELEDRDVSTHYQDDTVCVCWDEEDYPCLRKWLLETYGEAAKQHEQFLIYAT